MHRINILVVLIFLIFCSCSSEKTIIIKNDSNLDRIDEGISLSRNQVERITGAIPEGHYPELYLADGTVFPGQLDDLDGDGAWDELFFIAEVGAGEELEVKLRFLDEVPDYGTRTNIRFAKVDMTEIVSETRLESNVTQISGARYQFEGPGWENDKVGFRNYYDRRNGIDIFGKITSEMVLDRVDSDESVSYHDLHDWGMDVLKVGTSLGAGSLGMASSERLWRVGDSGVGDFKLVTEGPVRSIFRLGFKDWKMGDEKVDLVHEICIVAGFPGYMSTVTVTGLESEAELVSGIVNLHSKEVFLGDPSDSYHWMATHDRQAELEKYLGMGLIYPTTDFKGSGEAMPDDKEITDTYYIKLNISNGKAVSFYFIAGWELQDSRYADRKEFLSELDRLARILDNNPLKVSIR